MNKYLTIAFFCSFIGSFSFGQKKENYSDQFLSESFKVFHSADFDMAYHLKPFIRKRFVGELKDSSSFYNPYDSLSRKYVRIKYSSDSLVKTYSWDERSGSCCHSSATFAQFKTQNGRINYVDLEKPYHDGIEIFITDLQKIEFNDSSYYLILGWGTCCGGKHYEIARLYQILNNQFIQVDSMINGKKDLIIGANRGSDINLEYNPERKELSYNFYEFDDDIGFYKKEKKLVTLSLKKNGFKKLK